MRGMQLLKAAIVAAAVSLAAPAAADAQPVTATCVGTTTLGPPIDPTSRTVGAVTIDSWAFTGVQDLCLADGSVVVAAMAGHLTLITREDGTGLIVVRYALTIPGGTLHGIVQTRFSPTTFDARVVAFGGTGVLTGMSGHGSTQMTGPNTFLGTMVYRYR